MVRIKTEKTPANTAVVQPYPANAATKALAACSVKDGATLARSKTLSTTRSSRGKEMEVNLVLSHLAPHALLALGFNVQKGKKAEAPHPGPLSPPSTGIAPKPTQVRPPSLPKRVLGPLPVCSPEHAKFFSFLQPARPNLVSSSSKAIPIAEGTNISYGLVQSQPLRAAYLISTADHPLKMPHPKDSEVTITLLIHNSRNLNMNTSSGSFKPIKNEPRDVSQEAKSTVKELLIVQATQLKAVLAVKRHVQQNPSHEPRFEDRLRKTKDVAEPDQVQAQQQNASTANDRPKSFADVARPLSKEKLRSAWGQIRERTERVEAEGDQPLAVAFTYHGTENGVAECILAIPYDRNLHSVADVLSTVEAAFPSAIICDYSTAGVLFLLFESKEERDRVATTPVECPSGILRALPAIRSTGTRIRIRVDDMNVASVHDRRTILESVYGGYGKILHINDHALKGSKLLVASFYLVLELPQGTSMDRMIPRVAPVMGQNVLFMWNSAPFCLRCGSDAHTKVTCPRPLDFKVRNDPALAEPLLVRAFANPQAPHCEPAKKAQAPAPIPAPSKSKGKAPSDSDWTVVGSQSQGPGFRTNLKATLATHPQASDDTSEGGA
ncbi:hypothetical protein EC968_005345 [Mortierella alpina]|nr:hypothetical protein EC968_005345 [Mortierella alpina]